MKKRICLIIILSMTASLAFGQGLRRSSQMTPGELSERDTALSKMQSALKEITGVTLGQPESDSLPRKNFGEWASLKKPYRYFTKINPQYLLGKLTGVTLYFDTEKKYTPASIEAEIDASVKDIGGRLGYVPEKHDLRSARERRIGRRSTSLCINGWQVSVGNIDDFVYLEIEDRVLTDNLRKEYKIAKESKLLTLPVFNSDNSMSKAVVKEKRENEEACMIAALKESESRRAERKNALDKLDALDRSKSLEDLIAALRLRIELLEKKIDHERSVAREMAVAVGVEVIGDPVSRKWMMEATQKAYDD